MTPRKRDPRPRSGLALHRGQTQIALWIDTKILERAKRYARRTGRTLRTLVEELMAMIEENP